MNAFVNGELGTVKYVGRVEFAEGIWVGLHLKNQSTYITNHNTIMVDPGRPAVARDSTLVDLP